MCLILHIFSDHWITWCLKFFNYCCDKLIYQVFLLLHKSQTAVSSWKKSIDSLFSVIRCSRGQAFYMWEKVLLWKKCYWHKDFWLNVQGKMNNMWCRKNTQMYILDVSFPESWEIDVMETNLKITIMIFHWAASERCLHHRYPVLQVIWYEQKCMLCTVAPVILNSTYCIWKYYVTQIFTDLQLL